jgi:SpoVK/Ycf46/Vps4 family AAA+-type ATPase
MPTFEEYIAAGYPLLFCETYEIKRAIQEFTRQAEQLEFDVWTWDCCDGFFHAKSGHHRQLTPEELPAALTQLEHKTIVLAQNLSWFLDDIYLVQALHNAALLWRGSSKALVTISPEKRIPPPLEKLTGIVDFPLPDTNELSEILNRIATEAEIELPENIQPILDASAGLTEFEAENAFAISAIYDAFDARKIADFKMQTIKKTGLLEIWDPMPLDQLGGLENLKQFLLNRKRAFQDPNLPRIKGCLLLGIPGTGKSLAAKVAASIFEVPLIRLDIPALKSSLVGESEARMRQVTKILDGIRKAVLWCDEIEKQVAGMQSSGLVDAGTTSGMLSHLLTWQQETEARILLMATANSLNGIPPEFLRAGRFDAIWFVDLPNSAEITEIIRIMNRRYNTDIPESWASKLRGFTGAEIEQLARDSLFDGLEEAYKNIVPIERTMKEEIKHMREWARMRARLANGPASDQPKSTSRKIHKYGCPN